jgi:hypothetical protein
MTRFNESEAIFKQIKITNYHWESLFCIATGYGSDGGGIVVWFPEGEGDVSLLHSVRVDPGVHPASYPMRVGGYLPGSKAAGAWSWPLTSI